MRERARLQVSNEATSSSMFWGSRSGGVGIDNGGFGSSMSAGFNEYSNIGVFVVVLLIVATLLLFKIVTSDVGGGSLFTSSDLQPGVYISIHPETPRIMLQTVFKTDATSLILLQHFLEHYLSQGFNSSMIFITLQTDDVERKEYKAAVRLLKKYDIVAFKTTNRPYSESLKAHEYNSWIGLQRIVKEKDWLFVPEMDEFIEFPFRNVKAFLYSINESIPFVYGVIKDRISASGALVSLDKDKSIWEQMPYSCDLDAYFFSLPYKPNRTITIGHQANKRVPKAFNLLKNQFEVLEVDGSSEYVGYEKPLTVHKFRFLKGYDKLNQLGDDLKEWTSESLENKRLRDYLAKYQNRICISCSEFTCSKVS